MTGIVADISASLDGFVTGPDAGPDSGLGTGGRPIHAWAFSDDPEDARILRESTARSAAVILGRNLFDVVDGVHGWSDEVSHSARETGSPPDIIEPRQPARKMYAMACGYRGVFFGPHNQDPRSLSVLIFGPTRALGTAE